MDRSACHARWSTEIECKMYKDKSVLEKSTVIEPLLRMDEPPMDHYGMSYHPQSEDSLGHQPSTSIFPFMPSQKRVRTDSNTFESGEPQGLRASGVILMTSNGMHAMDLSTVVSQILARCEQLEKQNTDLKSDLDMTKITYDAQIHTLEESVDTLKDEMIASRSGTKTKTQPVRQDSAVTVSSWTDPL
jgi:hypothetical protein